MLPLRLVERFSKLSSVLILALGVLHAQTTVYSYTVPSTNGYDAVGNLLSYTDNINGNWALNYDSLNRLATASSSAGVFNGITLQQQYDSFGNRWGQSSSTAQGASPSVAAPSRWAQFNLTNNRLSAADTAVGGVSYDYSGNITNDGQNQNVFDGDGRLCASKSSISGVISQYIYNAEGQRTAKLTGASTLACYTGSSTDGTPSATYLLGPGGEQVTETNGSGTWKHTNVFSGGQIIASYDAAGLHFPVHDPLGSLRAEVSGTGTIEETCANLPFGDGQSCNSSITEPNELHFSGKERDEESGMDFFGARYYGSSMGRWMSPDWAAKAIPVPYAKLEDPQSLNLYSYVGNNPLGGIDPDGHSIDCSGSNASGAGCQAIAQFNADHHVLSTESKAAITNSKMTGDQQKSFTKAVETGADKGHIDPNVLVGMAQQESTLGANLNGGAAAQGLYGVEKDQMNQMNKMFSLDITNSDLLSLGAASMTKVSTGVGEYLGHYADLYSNWSDPRGIDIAIGWWRVGGGNVRSALRSGTFWDYVAPNDRFKEKLSHYIDAVEQFQ